MLWFDALLTLAVCGAIFELVRRVFHLGDEDGDPHEARLVGAVVAVLTLIVLDIVSIFLPYTLVWLGAACLTSLGFVRLMAAEHTRPRQAEDAPLSSDRPTHSWDTP